MEIDWYRQLIVDIIANMPKPDYISRENTQWLHDNPAEMHDAFLNVLNWGRKLKFKTIIRPRMKKKFRTWKTVKVGTFRNPDDLAKAIDNKKYLTVGRVDCLMSRVKKSFMTTPGLIKLVKVSLEELGLDSKEPIGHVYERAEELGLREAPAEVGPQLLIQYTRQPAGEKLIIGMKPDRCDCGNEIFRVSNIEGKRILAGAEGNHWKNVTSDDGLWVFAQAERAKISKNP